MNLGNKADNGAGARQHPSASRTHVPVVCWLEPKDAAHGGSAMAETTAQRKQRLFCLRSGPTPGRIKPAHPPDQYIIYMSVPTSLHPSFNVS